MELGTFRSVTLMLEKQVIDSCQWPGTKQKHMSQEVDATSLKSCLIMVLSKSYKWQESDCSNRTVTVRINMTKNMQLLNSQILEWIIWKHNGKHFMEKSFAYYEYEDNIGLIFNVNIWEVKNMDLNWTWWSSYPPLEVIVV